MFGTLLSNRLLLQLVKAGDLVIDPFEASRLRTSHYPIRAASVNHALLGDQLSCVHVFDSTNRMYELKPDEYCVVRAAERISVPDGIVGLFLPSSNLIEQGLGLTAGRLESPFGMAGERVRFGLKNLLNRSTTLRSEDIVAYVHFFDLRGQHPLSFELSPRDKKILADHSDSRFDSGVISDPFAELSHCSESKDP